MKLHLSLEETSKTWEFPDNPERIYQAGSNSDCDIFLSHVRVSNGINLQFRYDKRQECWYLANNGSGDRIIVNDRLLEQNSIPIETETKLKFPDGRVLIAIPLTDNSSISEFKPSSLITSTRILSGTAYWQGIKTSLNLLDWLRSDPYKASIPNARLDIKKITTHASKAIAISLVTALIVLVIAVVQIYIIKISELNLIDFFFFNLSNVSLAKSTFIYLILLAAIPSLILAYEQVYLRWFNACKFLKNNYKLQPNPTINFLPNNQIGDKLILPIVNYFKDSIERVESDQNIIIFAGSNPFLGAGEQIAASNWTIPIERKEKDANLEGLDLSLNSQINTKHIDIPIEDFYEAVDREVKQIDLPNIQKYSRLFVDGFELETDSKVITNITSKPGVISIENPLWLNETKKTASNQRAYRLYQYVDLGRDYVLSHFLRFYNAGSITFIESSAYILPGIDRERFSLTSTLEDNNILRIIKMILLTLLFIVFPILYVIISIWYVALFLFNFIKWEFNDNKQKRMAKLQEEYNYGKEETLREFIAEPLTFESYQKKLRLLENKKGFNISISIKRFMNPIGIILLLFLLPVVIVVYLFNLFRKLDRDIKINYDYYGTQDVLMYWKSIQDAIYKSTINLLKEKGVDVSDFEQAMTAIINNGTMVTAGNIANSQFAVGSNISQGTNQQPSA